ncbi:hypothetical protein A9P82_06300 [Arachidicoccus ginsenosidimutans]|uniref:hypothetical protein n=1 Tax=Arachidicoccus sp. BS20 TaxID=1850526 RepID=UPI0007F15BE2|nr:hypothetical protein [Arachidicoccus sp. BS20]ANI88939.1 hypothetical protein A9P82_06300 [Arachidicoccus sp. BS20]
MAEEEKIIAHAKQAVHALTNKNKKWKEKIQDFLLEILIIIIAVSITLWFHNWNDEKHDKEIEKNFLIGTRNDLAEIDSNLFADIQDFQPTIDYYDSAITELDSNRINSKYLDTNSGFLLNTEYFNFDNSRFESFKSSGYLRLIENQKLLSNITRLYITTLPFTANNDANLFDSRRIDYKNFIGNKTGKYAFDGFVPIDKIIRQPEVEYHIRFYGSWLNEAKRHKKELMKDIETVTKEIDTELKDRFDYDVSDKK